MPFLSNPENKSRHKEVGTKKSAQRSRHKEVGTKKKNNSSYFADSRRKPSCCFFIRPRYAETAFSSQRTEIGDTKYLRILHHGCGTSPFVILHGRQRA